jgi:hypothetical protein
MRADHCFAARELHDATDYLRRAKSLLVQAAAEENAALARILSRLGEAFLESAEVLLERVDAATRPGAIAAKTRLLRS